MNQERKVVPILAPSKRTQRLTTVLSICDYVIGASLMIGAACVVVSWFL